MNEHNAKQIIKHIKALRPHHAEIYASGSSAMLNINNTLLAKIPAVDAQKIKDKDYKKPVVDLSINDTRYKDLEYQLDKLSNRASDNRVEFTDFKYHRPAADQVVAFGHTDEYIVAIDDLYKEIAELLDIGHKVTADKADIISFVDYRDNVYCTVAPVYIWECDTFINQWEKIKDIIVN